MENPDFWLKHIHPEDKDETLSNLNELERKKQLIYEYRFKVKDGSYHWMRDTVQLIFDDKGNPIETVGYVLDITETKQAELKLKESEEKYRLITENAYDFIAVANLNMEYEYINKAFKKIMGYSNNEFIGKNRNDLVHPDDLKYALKHLNDLLTKGEAFSSLRVKKKNGKYAWLELSGKTFISSKKTEKIILIGRDITDRKKTEHELKKSEKLYRQLFDNSPISIVLFDAKGVILDVNSTLENFIGYNRKDLKGKNYLDLPEMMKPEMIPILSKRLRKHFKGEKIDPITVEIVKKDGTGAFIRPNISMFQIESEILGLAIFDDITEVEKAKQQLKSSEENYRRAYEQADFYKDIFTHDMLNILNNIKGSFQVYKVYKNKEDKSEKIDEMMNIINEQVINGIKLINNIRQLSKLEEKPEEILKSVNICTILKNAIDFIYKSYEKRKVIIYGNFPDRNLMVKANDLLLGVFENILINAIKYNTNIPVKIYISMIRERKNDVDHVKIDFIDNGIGINDELKEIIFKEGYKKEKRSKGMGFGLTLVKKLIDAYNGQIWVEDKIKGDSSQGTKFSIIIPESR